jgi:isopenicillin-N N-acyltransferase-like protein
MNDAGLCVATLDVYESGDGSSHFDPLGVPLTLVFRQILEECTTVDDAEALLKKTHATTQANLAVCDRDTAAVFEITPKQVARRNAANATLPCTNHFRMPGLAVNEECWRYDRLQAAVAKPSLTVADVHHALHAANQGEFTLQTMVFEPRKLVLHLAMGTPPSSQCPLRRLDIKSILSSQKRSD